MAPTLLSTAWSVEHPDILMAVSDRSIKRRWKRASSSLRHWARTVINRRPLTYTLISTSVSFAITPYALLTCEKLTKT